MKKQKKGKETKQTIQASKKKKVSVTYKKRVARGSFVESF